MSASHCRAVIVQRFDGAQHAIHHERNAKAHEPGIAVQVHPKWTNGCRVKHLDRAKETWNIWGNSRCQRKNGRHAETPVIAVLTVVLIQVLQVQLGGRGSHKLDLSSYSSGIYTAVMKKNNLQSNERKKIVVKL